MARQIGTNLDLLLNQLLNAKFQILAADPGAPVEGQFWYNSTAQVFKYRTATTTIVITDDSAAIALKANIASPVFTGDPQAPTPAAADNDTSIATTAFVKTAITNLINSSPATLDTLKELADAIGDDPNFATTITTLIGTKAGKFNATIGDGVATSIVVTHNLNTRAVVVSVHDATTFNEIEVDVQKTSVNTVTIGFATAPAAASRVVTVIG